MRTKKEFCNTITRRSKNLVFPGKMEFMYTIMHGKEITKKLQQVQKTEMLVSGLIEYGFGYNGVKRFLSEKERDIFIADFK